MAATEAVLHSADRVPCQRKWVAFLPREFEEEAQCCIDFIHVGAVKLREEADANSPKEIHGCRVASQHLPADDQTLQRPKVVPLIFPFLPRFPMLHLSPLWTHQYEGPASCRRHFLAIVWNFLRPLTAGLLDGLSAGFLAERMYPK